MTKNIHIWTGLLCASITFGSMGCELIASVDRSKILDDTSADGGIDSSIDGSAGNGGSAGTGGSGGSGGTAGTGGSGGTCAGGAKACTGKDDCATGAATACIVASCTSGCCATEKAASGAVCNDNGGKLCDGAGLCVACMLPTDCPVQTTVCKVNACSQAHACATTNADKGTTCSDSAGTVCDGKGACVAGHCTDGVKDSDETDIDCGGSCGASCKDTGPQQACSVAADCISGVCSGTPKLCQAPSCSDGAKNGSETDRDCGGGTCPLCVDKLHCTQNTDCAKNFCFGSAPGTCVSCEDGAQDGNETDLDCGGAQCNVLKKTCDAGKKCDSFADCSSTEGCTGTSYTSAATCSAGKICEAGTAKNCSTTAEVCNATKGCVQCNSAVDCSPASCNGVNYTPAATCNTSNSCVASTPTACSGGKVCNAVTGCVECNTNDECPASCSGTNYIAQGICNKSNACAVGTSTDCAATKKVCKAVTGCVQCNADTDCAASCEGTMYTAQGTCDGANACVAATPSDCATTGKVCSVAAGCVQCNLNSDCSAPNPTCTNHVCVP